MNRGSPAEDNFCNTEILHILASDSRATKMFVNGVANETSIVDTSRNRKFQFIFCCIIKRIKHMKKI